MAVTSKARVQPCQKKSRPHQSCLSAGIRQGSWVPAVACECRGAKFLKFPSALWEIFCPVDRLQLRLVELFSSHQKSHHMLPRRIMKQLRRGHAESCCCCSPAASTYAYVCTQGIRDSPPSQSGVWTVLSPTESVSDTTGRQASPQPVAKRRREKLQISQFPLKLLICKRSAKTVNSVSWPMRINI